MSFPPLWGIFIPYLIWIQFDKAPDRGGRSSTWIRGLPIWKWFAGKFMSIHSQCCFSLSKCGMKVEGKNDDYGVIGEGQDQVLSG